MSFLGAVFRKELIDSLRDHRSLMGALILPIAGPLMFALMFTFLAEKHSDEKPIDLPVIGRANAPSLMGWLEQNDVNLKEPPDDPDSAVRDGDVHAVLTVPDDYAEKFRAGTPARLVLLVDSSNDDARVTSRKVRALLETWGGKVGQLRLLAHGVAPDLASPVNVDEIDLATPKRRAAQLLSMIPMFAMLAAFVGGMNVAIDCTAGERERRSLEPLLINPVSRLQLAAGKWLVVSGFNIAVAILTLVVFQLVLQRVPLHELGVTVDFGATQVLSILGLLVPMALFAGALMMLVSLFARSFKEAQTYLSVLVFVPMLPSLVQMLNPVKPTALNVLIPTFGQTLLVNDVMRGETLMAAQVVTAALATLFLAGLLLVAIGRLFTRERIVFGR